MLSSRARVVPRIAPLAPLVPLVAWLGTTGAACESDPRSRAPTVTAAPSDAAVGPRPLTLPTGTCHVTASDSVLDAVPLRLAPDGPPYALAGHARGLAMQRHGDAPADARPSTFAADVVVPDGAATMLGVTYRTTRLVVHGLVAPDDLRLYPAHAAITGGFLIARQVRITQAAGAQATVEPVRDPAVELVAAAPATVACADLALDEPEHVDALAPAVPTRVVRKVLRGGAPIDLAVEPGGPAVARLRVATADTGDARIEVLETRGATTRIRWDRDAAIVFGWVASTALAPLPPPGEGKMGTGGFLRAEPAPASVRCEHDVALAADVAGARTIVGTVRAGSTIDVLERAGGTARINVPRPGKRYSPDITPTKGVTLWVAEADLAGCPAAPTEPKSELDLMEEALQHSDLGKLPLGKSR